LERARLSRPQVDDFTQAAVVRITAAFLLASAIGAPALATSKREHCDATLIPRRSVERTVNAAHPGDLICLHGGVYREDVTIRAQGSRHKRIVIQSSPGERAVLRGRLWVTARSRNIVFRSLELYGRNKARLPSPTVNGDHITFVGNDVHFGPGFARARSCFTSDPRYGRARGLVISRNEIHHCGERPPTNHHHGIYLGGTDGARITHNWIHDNADRGIQLYADADRTRVRFNLIERNGEGVLLGGDSDRNVVELNVIQNSTVRWNVEDHELVGTENVVQRNCVWQPGGRYRARGGIQQGIAALHARNIVGRSCPSRYGPRRGPVTLP
jgi:nitrous oxidase accessory protein NosD